MYIMFNSLRRRKAMASLDLAVRNGSPKLSRHADAGHSFSSQAGNRSECALDATGGNQVRLERGNGIQGRDGKAKGRTGRKIDVADGEDGQEQDQAVPPAAWLSAGGVVKAPMRRNFW
jgi:hypothetical protein